MTVHLMEQGTPEWLAVRLGKFTASNAAKLMSGKDTAGYQECVNRVVYERITGESPETFKSAAMQRGNELEPIAREAYIERSFNEVLTVGFVERDEWTGWSPDGLVGVGGACEIKCPLFSTLINSIIKGTVPSEYQWQIQFGLMVSGRAWCDYFSYHPKMKPLLVRVNRDAAKIVQIEERLAESITLAKQRLIELV